MRNIIFFHAVYQHYKLLIRIFLNILTSIIMTIIRIDAIVIDKWMFFFTNITSQAINVVMLLYIDLLHRNTYWYCNAVQLWSLSITPNKYCDNWNWFTKRPTTHRDRRSLVFHAGRGVVWNCLRTIESGN